VKLRTRLLAGIACAAWAVTALAQNHLTDTDAMTRPTFSVEIERKTGSAAYALVATVDVTPSTTSAVASALDVSAKRTAHPLPVPSAPTLQVSASSSSQVVLTWTPSLGTTQPQTWADSGLQPATSYTYRIRLKNPGGTSPYSNEATATTLQVTLAAPSNLKASSTSPNQVNLTWTNNASSATATRIEYHASSSSTYIDAGAATSLTSSTIAYLQPSTPYTFRVRAQSGAVYSGYSNETTATTQDPPPSAPTIQASSMSSTQVQLTWTSSAFNIVRFHVERRTGTVAYAEVAQPSPGTSTWNDSGLQSSTAYTYRMRVETAAGLSPYSNEVSATTHQGLPGAPSNLSATATSSTQVNLTWKNNAPDSTAIRVEVQSGSTFVDIGAAATLTSTPVTNNLPNTTYTFRVRAENAAGYSAYSNNASVTTLAPSTTVFLIHGIDQGGSDMQALHDSLTGESGLDSTRFRVDFGFDFGECAAMDFCTKDSLGNACSISGGAFKLASYINQVNPPGDIVLIGYSMGGLLARDMIANNWLGVLNNRKVAALVTLGTPNVGYPYAAIDTTLFCTPLVQEMNGNWRIQQSQNLVQESSYLAGLNTKWSAASYPGVRGTWLAASGRYCSNPIRAFDSTTGCRDLNPLSDCIVCDDSASFSIGTTSGTAPTLYWQDPSRVFVHTNSWGGLGTAAVLGANSGDPTRNPPLYNPPTFGSFSGLFSAIRNLINGL